MYALMCFSASVMTDSFELNCWQSFDETLRTLPMNKSDLSLGKQINARKAALARYECIQSAAHVTN